MGDDGGDDRCRLNFFDLHKRAIPEVRLNENFAICTWKVRVIVDRVDRVVDRGGMVGGGPTQE